MYPHPLMFTVLETSSAYRAYAYGWLPGSPQLNVHPDTFNT